MVGSAVGDCIGVVIADLTQVGVGVPKTRAGKNPVQMGVGQVCDVATGSAFPAGCAPRFAEQMLGKPDRQALLADSARALQQQAGRKFTGANGGRQTAAQLVVAE